MADFDRVAGVDSLYNFPPEVIAALVQAEEMKANYVQMRTTAPNPAKVKAYIDISVVPPVLKGYNGTAWVALGGTATDTTTTTPTTTNALLTESGDILVLETGDLLLVS